MHRGSLPPSRLPHSQMSLAKVLAQAEAAVLDAQIGQLKQVKFLSEQEVVGLAAKCKVRGMLACSQKVLNREGLVRSRQL